jgi:hypothetical protein
MEEWRYGPTILYLHTRWRRVVSFMPWLFYPQYPLDMRLGGPWNRSGFYEEEKNLAPARIERQLSGA